MERRKVTILIGGQPIILYSDDPDEYLSALEQRANEVMRETSRFAGSSPYTNAMYTVLSLTDELLRAEQKTRNPSPTPKMMRNSPGKNPEKTSEKDQGQISVWELLEPENKNNP